MAELKKHYDALIVSRQSYDTDAYRNARYAVDAGVTALDSFGSQASSSDTDYEIVTSFGKSLVRGLSSTLNSVMFPARVPFLNVDVEFNDDDREADTELLGKLSKLQKSLMRRFDRMSGKSVVKEAITHAIVGNATALHFRDEDGRGPDRIRMFPFRSFALEYEDTFLRRMIVHEERHELVDDDTKPKKTAEFWTEINFVDDLVRQEDKNGKIIEPNDKAVRWMVVSNERPYIGRHYPKAFLSHHIEALMYLNFLRKAFRDITGEMANIIKGVKPGSGLDHSDVAQWRGPTCVSIRNADDIFYITAGVKINDATILKAVIEDIEDTLKREYLQGLLQNNQRIETATEVREITAEMNAMQDQFYSHHADFTQMPIAKALMDMQDIRFEGNNGRVEPVILTGVSAILQQEQSETLLRMYTAIVAVNPSFAEGFPIGLLFKRLADSRHIQTDDLYPDKLQFIDLAKQLIAQVKQNPTETVPLLLQMLQPFLGDGAPQNGSTQAGIGALAQGLAGQTQQSPAPVQAQLPASTSEPQSQ